VSSAEKAGASGTPLLEIRGLDVVFDGFRAISGVDLTVCQGELRFLIGPNGAGKTTIIDVVTGLTKPAAGSVRFGGTELLGKREHEIVRCGVGRTFQAATVFEELTVAENLDLAVNFRQPLRRLLRARKGLGERVEEVLATTRLTELAEHPAGVLSHGQRQWLEIGMLVAQDPRLLLLDEPVAGMSADERELTGALLQDLATRHTVVVIEHDMEFLRRFADQVTVLHEGKVLVEGTVAQVQADPRVQEVYLGRSKAEPASTTAAAATKGGPV
jgi:urea transport system ATP-binding protein